MAGKRILIIDDAVFQSEVLREVFENEFGDKIDVEIAKDFNTTEEVLLSKDVDLVMVDYLLGAVGTGAELKKRVQEELETEAHWMMMSALDVNALAEKHRSDGFLRFVHKSDYRELTKEVSGILFP